MELNTYQIAKEAFAEYGVDTELAISVVEKTPISLHCWQGDDVKGLENNLSAPGSGCLATGNYPWKARNLEELLQDLDECAKLIPGALKVNLHANYASDNNDKVDRSELTAKHFKSWTNWAKSKNWGIDFNPTFFAHPMATDGFTLSSNKESIRSYWIKHAKASRQIAADIAKELGQPATNNIWIPDAYKDVPADRFTPREILKDSLEKIFADPIDKNWCKDFLESKLFGIGVESYTVGSHEFYLGFAGSKGVGLCLDAGHFHPTESVADKVSSTLLFVPELLLHVSRGVRWDSDHVVLLDDPTLELLHEVAVSNAMDRIYIGMDFFDASINRLSAWVVGARNTRKALLKGLLSPHKMLTEAEREGDYTKRMAIRENWKSLPWGFVWNEFCRRQDKPSDDKWYSEIVRHEREILSIRSQ